MSIGFNAEDILLMAEQIERNGARFYRTAADCTVDPDTRQVLLNLAAMEDKHEETFIDMRKKLTSDERRPTAFDPDGQEATYLKILANDNVFNPEVDPAEMLTGKDSMEEILKIAIGLEKDSIVFYQGMKKFVPKIFGVDKLDAIIEEGFSHIAILCDKLSST